MDASELFHGKETRQAAAVRPGAGTARHVGGVAVRPRGRAVHERESGRTELDPGLRQDVSVRERHRVRVDADFELTTYAGIYLAGCATDGEAHGRALGGCFRRAGLRVVGKDQHGYGDCEQREAQ